MGIFGDLFNSIFSDSDNNRQVVHPCTNCPSNCPIAPDACSVCQPYKEQMINAIYNVEHKEEIISQYEVVGTSAAAGAVTCPHCGGASENHYVCEYCGSTLKEGSGKIQVASAADIPNPVLEAQDIIFARYDAVKNIAGDGYGLGEALSSVGSEGLFGSILGALIGADPSDKKSIGQKMTEDEINEMAESYGVSVSAYLTGLDNGRYLTMSNKSLYDETEKKYSRQSTSQSMGLGSMAGIAGMAGLGSVFGLRSNSRSSSSQYGNYGRSVQPQQHGGSIFNPGPSNHHPQTGRVPMTGHPSQTGRTPMTGHPSQIGRTPMAGHHTQTVKNTEGARKTEHFPKGTSPSQTQTLANAFSARKASDASKPGNAKPSVPGGRHGAAERRPGGHDSNRRPGR